MAKNHSQVREQAVVYLTASERELLERVAEETGLSRTEIFRRGLRRIADEMLAERHTGASLDYLATIARDTDGPEDLAERHDHYLYGGGHRAHGDGDDAGPP